MENQTVKQYVKEQLNLLGYEVTYITEDLISGEKRVDFDTSFFAGAEVSLKYYPKLKEISLTVRDLVTAQCVGLDYKLFLLETLFKKEMEKQRLLISKLWEIDQEIIKLESWETMQDYALRN